MENEKKIQNLNFILIIVKTYSNEPWTNHYGI